MTTPTTAPRHGTEPANASAGRRGRAGRLLRTLIVDRVAFLVAITVILVVWMKFLSDGGYLVATYDTAYMASALESFVPLCILGLAELLVIVSGRGGIDLSVGSMVSLVGMVFGLMIGEWHWPPAAAIVVSLAAAAVLGTVNGVLIAVLRFPALIATLATYYAYSSLALLTNGGAPISTKPVQRVHDMTAYVTPPGGLPAMPEQVFTFLLPCAIVIWLLVNRTTYGRRLYAVGTNEGAARYAALPVAGVRCRAYVLSGLLSGVVAIVTVGQFASARPDAGTVGNGMALPAITIAVLGGVAITGGVGRVGGVIVAALFVVWLNAGILLYFEGSQGSQYQLFALGAVLIVSALINAMTLRRHIGRSR